MYCNRREGQIKVLLGMQPKLITVVAFSDHKDGRECRRRGESSNKGHSLSCCHFRKVWSCEALHDNSLACSGAEMSVKVGSLVGKVKCT